MHQSSGRMMHMQAAPVPSPSPITVSSVLGSSNYAPLAASAAFGKVLRQSVAAICVGSGFDAADPRVLELLTHAASAYMKEICEGARLATEVAGRTNTIPADIWLSLINMGHNVSALPSFLEQQNGRCITIAPPKVLPPPLNPLPLRVGSTRSHHPHIHDFFPPFPDPHTYVRTEISLEPDQSYERARELLAQQKREAEISLTDFFLRTHPTHCIYRDMETRLRNEAKSLISARMEREAMKKANRRAAKRKHDGETITPLEELPDELLEEEDVTQKANRNQNNIKEEMEEEEEDELTFDVYDTENSLLRKRIPIHCFILDPTHEQRPYLSALVGEDGMQEEENVEQQEHVGQQTLPTTNGTAIRVTDNNDGDDGGTESGRNNDERAFDNPYLRAPKIRNN